MKYLSLNHKLFLSLSCILLTALFTILFLNSTAFELYYTKHKENTLIKTYETFNNMYNSMKLEQSDFLDFEKIEINQNLDIVIKDFEKITIYSTEEDFTSNMIFIDRYSNIAINEFFEKKLSGSQTAYSTELLSDTKLAVDFLVLYGKLDNGYLLLLRTPFESIHESVEAINRFLIFISMIAIFLASVLAYYFSKSFTKPIKELNEIAKGITELDFSKKYVGTNNDEIGILGSNINQLSDSLRNKIQELNNINLELEKDIEETSKLAEMRSQFVSDISHELKTPITLIQGYAEGLVDGIVTDENDKKYYLEVILDEANKMSKLTRALLDLSNLEYGNNDLNIETFDIVNLVNTTLKKSDIIFKENNINISFEHSSDSILVTGDVFRIEQVLTNYINNALKHVDENNIIKVKAILKETHVKVSVFNSGKNISEENLSRIWTKFYKEDLSRNRESSGSGIGLSLVQAIMKKHNNKYGVANASDGVEFWFELDIAK